MKKNLSALFVLATLVVQAQVSNSGLVAHYSFDSTMTGTNGHTLPGVANYVADRNSNANSAHNIGTSTMNNAGIPNLPTGNNARTVAFWYKSNSNTTHSLFNYGLQTDYFGIVYDATASQILVADGGSGLSYSVSRPYSGLWTHVAVTYQAPTTSIYINGVLAGSTNTLSFNTSASPSRLGVSPFGGQFGNYQMDDLLIYGRALTLGEVSVLYNNTCPSITTLPANLNVCQGATANLSVTGTNIDWYDDLGQVGTGNNFTTPPVTQTTTYQAASSSSTCYVLVTVTALPSPVGNITLSNDTIKSTNTLFDSYVLKKDGSTVASGNSGGGFNYATTACGTYQAEFTNVTNSCPNRSSNLTYNSGTCQQTVNITSLPTPAFYSLGLGVEPNEPTTAMNGTQLSFVYCQNALVIIKVRDANGCLYRAQWTLTAFPQFVTFTSSSDTTTTCTIFSNTVTIAPTAPTNTTPTINQQVCSGSTTTLSATGTGTLYWFDAPTGGTQVGTGNSFITPALTISTTYYVQSGLGTCASSRTAVAITINANPSAAITPATVTICNGQSTTLTASGGGTYTWSNSGGGNAAASFSPTTSTTYTVTVTNANNCTATASRLVNVNNVPIASISPATVSICNGASATLTASGGGTYAWSNSGGNNAAATFSPTTNTTYTVTVTGANSCSATASRLVSVNNSAVISSVTASIDTTCAGQTTSITANTTGTNLTYLWSNGHQFSTNPVSPTATTAYTVTVTHVPSSCTATATKTITVNSLPTVAISGIDSICPSGSTTLTATGGVTYVWNTNATTAGINVSPTTTTTYTVTATGSNGCQNSTAKNVVVNPAANAVFGPSTFDVCAGNSVTFTASSNANGSTYNWSTGQTGNPITVTPTSSGSYSLTVTTPNGCTATTSNSITYHVVTASINGPSTICSGTSATLTASGGGVPITYQWSNSLGIGSTKTVTPTVATTYTVTVTGSGNCTATASQTVSVQSAPTATISGANTVCAGSSTTLTANGGNTYEWSNSASTSAITVSPTANTTYTVTVSIGANCTATASHAVSILQPSTSSFSETICAGTAFTFKGLQLTQNGSYNDTLVNSIGCDSVITLNLTVLAPIVTTLNESICTNGSFDFNGTILTQAGQYFDTIPSALGCDSAITLNLSINTDPQITAQPTANATAVCVGETVTLNVVATGGNLSYQWKENNANEGPNAATYTTSVLSAGTKSYTVDISNSCGNETSNAVSVTVNALPNPTITQSGFTMSTQSFATYQWQLNGSDINGAQLQSYTAAANGNYTVEVTDANGCRNTSSGLNVTGVGINEVAHFRSVIYPNPATTELTVEAEELLQSVILTDVVGRIILSQSEIFSLQSKIDVSGLAESTYFIRITTTTGKTVIKTFVKN
ncbi:MAG: T9SS type A sorting domain-containing protein [Chitinophagales bacterium]|nr:T9SS type A sorting domain-containing protein [Chitinophagales bacterium]